MSVPRLGRRVQAELEAARFTYSEVGDTAGTFPAGYRTLQRNRRLPPGSFDSAVAELMSWRVHQRAGLDVRASGDVSFGAVAVLRLGVAAAAVQAPCRVVYMVEEADRRGFAYGTLPGHPESGEEAFIIERQPSGVVLFTIRAFSRPASALARAAGPLGHMVQDLLTQRYLRSALPR